MEILNPFEIPESQKDNKELITENINKILEKLI